MSEKGPCSVVQCSKEKILVGESGWIFKEGVLKSLLPKNLRFVGIVTDAVVGPLFGDKVKNLLVSKKEEEKKEEENEKEEERNEDLIVKVFTLPNGEATKHRIWKKMIETWLFENGAVKTSCLIALGGGVIGDLLGFVASSFLRGIPFIQLPTTLLAMVDSSIGGKTAVDVQEGKNLIGAFNHPFVVCLDPFFLTTLPLRHISNGMAEVIKVAVALDADAFGWLERSDVASLILSRDEPTLFRCIQFSAQLKASVIDEDERDAGKRNILNVGHTVGHGLEAILSPLGWLHGECVSVGTIVEALASFQYDVLGSGDCIERIKRVLKMYKLPVVLPFDDFKVESVVEFCKKDKKSKTANDIRCVFLSGIGSVGSQITYSMSEKVLRMLLSPAVVVVPSSSSSPSPSASPSPTEITLAVPGSKSVSNRVLLLAALGTGEISLSGLLHADDTYVTLDALSALGVQWSWDRTGSLLRIVGSGGQLAISSSAASSSSPNETEIYLGNAGTASRFLTAACTWLPVGQSVLLHGSPRLHERPIRPLVDALCRAGIKIEYQNKEGYFPIRVHGNGGFPSGGDIFLDSTLSSQFTSAVLMAAAKGGSTLTLTGELVSQPYVKMTIEIMGVFGVKVESDPSYRSHRIPETSYTNPNELIVEADASTSTYPLALAAITGKSVTVTNIGSRSLQGDAAFSLLLEKMGCSVCQTETTTSVKGPAKLTAIPEINMDHLTDAFMTMAVVAAVSHGTCRIVGISNQRVKECDRIAAMLLAFERVGIPATELPDGIEVVGQPHLLKERQEQQGESSSDYHLIECFKDHRIAMSLAVLGCVIPKIVLLDKACVEKTFPHFWQMLSNQFSVEVNGYEGEVPSLSSPSISSSRGIPSPLSDPQRKTVILIGMRMSGKTTGGKYLAKELGGRRWVDADDVFTTKTNLSPKEFVKEKGMEEFRRVEAEVLEELMKEHPIDTVISCGGGIIETPGGRAPLLSVVSPSSPSSPSSPFSFIVLHMRREWSSLEAALSSDLIRVPLAEPLSETWKRREPLFEMCSHVEYYGAEEKREGEDEEEKREMPLLLSLVKKCLKWKNSPVIRIGPGTCFVSLTLPTYQNDPTPLLTPPDCDAVELRADLLNKPHSLSLFRKELFAVRKRIPSLPIIFTLRSAKQGGEWTGSKEEYFEIAQWAIRSGCEFVDIEAMWGPPSSPFSILPTTQIIASDHSMSLSQPPPTLNRLASMAMSCSALFPQHPSIVKIVHRAFSPSDCQLAEQFYLLSKKGGPFSCISHPLSPGTIVLLVGNAGKLTRVRCPFMTPSTHESLPVAAAPGQLTPSQIRFFQRELGLGAVSPSSLLLFGSPIETSPSPTIHNAGLRAVGVPEEDLTYSLFETSSIQDVLNQMHNNPNFVGGNVTIPLKEKVFSILPQSCLSHAAQAIGAVNTLWKRRGGEKSRGEEFCGDNTDWKAIFELSRPHVPTQGLRVLVVGAGGTARAACYASQRLGATQISIVNRTVEKAKELERDFPPAQGYGSVEELKECPHLVLSCVPSSAKFVLPSEWVVEGEKSELCCVVELAYRPRETALLNQIKEEGKREEGKKIIAVEGWEILFEQGIWAWKLWCGRESAPVSEMHSAIQDLLDC